MPKYKYTALDIESNKVSDVAYAKDEGDFRKAMRVKNLVPLNIKLLDEKLYNYRLKADEVAEFCRQLSSMLSSGITAVRAMEILKERDFRPRVKNIYEKLYRDVQQGVAISEAMQQRGAAFPQLLINMFASGEASGRLDVVTGKMAVHYEKEHRLNGKIKSATRYPKILGVSTVIVMIVIFIIILPEFFNMLSDLELPLITQIIIALSDFLAARWYILLIAALVVIACIQYLLSVYKVRLAFDRLKLKLPVIGKLLKIIYTARFARTLSSLYSSGISMIRALEITGTIIMNAYIESQFRELVKNVRNGEALSESASKINGFDKKLSTTILIGEEAGRLDSMLISTADAFDYEAEMATGKIVALAEPFMIVIMALVVMSVLLAVMLPMASLYSGFGL